MTPIVSPETLLTFPIDPVGDFTFDGRTIAENTRFFHQAFTMEDDTLEVTGWVGICWKFDTSPFN